MPKSKRLNIFNINSNQSFLPSLVVWILQKYPDPLYLSNITILLPSRRACRELKKVFLSLSENEAVILPKIVAIGDVDYDEMFDGTELGLKNPYSNSDGTEFGLKNPYSNSDGTEFEYHCKKEHITPTPHQNSAGVLTPPQGRSDGTELEGQQLQSSARFNHSPLEGQQLQSSARFNHSPLEGESQSLIAVGGRQFIRASKFYSKTTLQRSRELRQSQTDAEGLLWYYLKNKQFGGYKFRRQQSIGKYIVDFICLEKKLIIELDGGHHNEAQNVKYDAVRDKFLREIGFRVLRFGNDEIFKNCDEVLNFVLNELDGPKADCKKEHITPTPHQNSAGVLTPPQGGSDGTEFGLKNPHSNSDGTEFGLSNPYSNSDGVDGTKLEYQLRLIQEIKNWNQKTNLFGKDISTASLAEIANNLQAFLDEVEKEGLNLDNLQIIDDAELASHKQQILKFLQYFGSVWQNVLAKEGIISAAKNRNLMLKNYNESLQKNGSQYPIIAAGSTGSVLAAAELLKTIASLENCQVVLFGLDQNLDENIWQGEYLSSSSCLRNDSLPLNRGNILPPSFAKENILANSLPLKKGSITENHPQFMLKKLLEKMEVARQDVANIEGAKQSDEFIINLCSLAMLPAEFIFEKQLATKNQIDSLTKIETENEFDEAKIIALLMRQALETKGKTAALISNDKNLIQLVKINLSAWQIEIDDSTSSNLAESELANYLFLISEFASNDFSAVNLLAVLKHPLSGFSTELLKVLEMEVLRDVVKFSSFDDLILKIKNNDELLNWTKQIAKIFQLLISEFKKDQIDFRKIVELHFDCLTQLTHSWCHPRLDRGFSSVSITSRIPDQIGDDTEYWNNIEGNSELLEFFQEISTTKTSFTLESSSYNRLLTNLLKNYQFRKSGKFHPRLHILSTMEARLMSYDLTIVSGLVEGEFPSKSSDDWLGNKIRAEFGLSSGAKKIGISAYDFCNYLGNKEVVLLYPKNQNNAPTIKSRFLLKLETVLKINGWEDCLKDGEEYLQLLNLDSTKQINSPRANPKPQKELGQKLQKISATDISKWLRNPYYIYAKRILQLKPLKQIEQDASFAEFGNFVHKVLEEFVKNYPKIDLENFGKEIFSNYFPDESTHLLWWPRFENIAKWFLKQEIELRKNLQTSFVEVEAQTIINDVILTTKVDRINLYQDGSYEIIDYKTGTLPAPKEIKSGLEPQLAVEAIVLTKGVIQNYSQLKISQINNLQYQNLKGKDQNEIKNLSDVDKLIAAADDGILRLLEMFNDQNLGQDLGQDLGYICCPNIDIYKQDDYWHLARIGEL